MSKLEASHGNDRRVANLVHTSYPKKSAPKLPRVAYGNGSFPSSKPRIQISYRNVGWMRTFS